MYIFRKKTISQLKSKKTPVIFRHLFAVALSIALSSVFAACASASNLVESGHSLVAEKTEWQDAFGDGQVGLLRFDEGGVKYSCAKIEVGTGAASIVAYPMKDGGKVLNKPIRMKKFVESTGAKIAINTSPFSKRGETIGIHIADGEKHSREAERYSALYFERDGSGFTAKISERQNERDFRNAAFAFGGFFTILKNGEILQFKHTSYDARSAAGISADGKTLFLLSVEKGLFGRGLSYPECAEILKHFGAEDAMEFDGGNSCSFFVEGKINFRESFRKDSAYMGFVFQKISFVDESFFMDYH